MDPTSEIIKIYCVADRALTMAARPRRSCSKDHGPVRNFEHGAGASGLKHHSDPVGGEDWEWCRPAVGQGWPVVWAEECGGTAVLVLALDNVPAKREVWMGWMLEVWEERMEVGRNSRHMDWNSPPRKTRALPPNPTPQTLPHLINHPRSQTASTVLPHPQGRRPRSMDRALHPTMDAVL